MDSIEQLRCDARAHRDAKIRLARQECARTMADIDRIARRMEKPLHTHYSPTAEGLSSTAHAQAILAGRGPLTVLEITVEAQARGYRPDDKPRRVTHAIRATLLYHKTRFVRVGEKWALG
jgi:hypothetical protein